MLQEAIATKNRFNVLLAALLIWAGLLSIRLFYFTVINRSSAFSVMESESVEKGRIRAMRGRILSEDGKVLAYSKRTTSLNISTSISGDQLNSLVEILEKELRLPRRQVLVKMANAKGGAVTLAENLSSKEISRFSRYFAKNSSVFLKMDFERIYTVKSGKLGRTAVEDGQLIGISGFESKYDDLLTGQDLVYEVMVDRQNKVIEKTYKEISKMEPGRDIHLSEKEWP
ncbi:MAG: hypothetical protein NE327_17940 [Lentisphaeraceae bacterium]|nr:hypothetical protein [Lentisphaeraceae bacterium]